VLGLLVRYILCFGRGEFIGAYTSSLSARLGIKTD